MRQLSAGTLIHPVRLSDNSHLTTVVFCSSLANMRLAQNNT